MSEQQLVDCVNGTNCHYGGMYDEGWDVVKKQGGIESEDSYPYVTGTVGHKLECRFEKQKMLLRCQISLNSY